MDAFDKLAIILNKERNYLLKFRRKANHQKEMSLLGFFLDTPETIFYKSIYLYQNCISLNNKDLLYAHELVDCISFITHTPIILDENYDEKTIDIFEELLSLIDFYSYDNEDLFKKKSRYMVFKVPDINNPELFSLYNSALKQSDPFARCVFLFRIIEYFHQNILKINKEKQATEDFVNDLIPKILKYKFYPLYKKKIYVKENKTTFKNVLISWKRKLNYFYNKDKNIYSYVYSFGRCGVAHGRGIKNDILYHTKENYKKINLVNIFLELISRYLIEKQNTNLMKNLNYTKKTIFSSYFRKRK